MSMKLLKISEFAALSGISRKSLIFYDACGILQPQRIDHENGYRYYSHRQLDTASVIVSLREAGMPLADIKDYLFRKSPEGLIEMFENQEQVLKEQIRKLERINGMIRSRIEGTRRGIAAVRGHVHLEKHSSKNLFLGPKLPAEYDLANGWAYLPEFYTACQNQGIQTGFTVGSLITQENLMRSRWDKPFCYYYGLPDKQYPRFFKKPAGIYAVGSEYTDYGHTDFLYKKIIKYIERKKLRVCGNAYEEYLIDEISEENPDHYLLQIAVQVRG